MKKLLVALIFSTFLIIGIALLTPDKTDEPLTSVAIPTANASNAQVP